MLPTTSQFKEAVQSPSRTTESSITFGVSDVTADGDAVYIATEVKPLSTVNALHLKERMPEVTPATFEPDSFRLDGSRVILDTAYTAGTYNLGWWSDAMSDANGGFIANPKVTVDFDDYHSSIGLSLTFQRDYVCSSFLIEWFDGANLLDQKLTEGNIKNFCIVENRVENYNKIVITITKTEKPFRYVRIMDIYFGIEETFWNTDRLINASVIEELDPTSSTLPVNKITLTVTNENQRFNMLNPEGVYSFLQRRQKISAQAGVRLLNGTYEYVDMGVYYLSDWKNSTGLTATLEAENLLGLLARTEYRNSPFYRNATIGSMIGAILTDAGVEVVVEIPPDLASIVLTGYIPIKSHRDAIRDVLIAARVTARMDRKGVLKIKKLNYSETPVTSIDDDRYTVVPTLEQKQFITTVAVTDFSYTLDSGLSEVKKVEVEFSGIRTITIDFDSAIDPSSLVFNLSGGVIQTVIEKSAVSCTLVVNGSGLVVLTLTAKKYTAYTVVVKASLPVLPAGEVAQTVTLEDINLVSGNGLELAQHLLDYYQRRVKQGVDYWADPSLECGDKIEIDTMFGTKAAGIVERQDVRIAPSLIAKVVVV